uniref:Cadherin-23-like n=1 Tax=Saccoglossus kowalevskii TaxID=10224 RepID=A0ABM0MVL1_SACKO
GEVSLIDLLDRENKTYHNLTLCVRDENPNHNDTTFLLVTVTDVNDNNPVITANDSSVMILEEEAGGVMITYVTATDEDDGTNAEWTYTIVDRLSNEFTVDGATGEVTTLRAFDREEQDTYEVYILAVDHGESQTCSFEPDIGVAEEYEEQPIGTIIYNMSTVSSATSFEIVDDSDYNGLFVIDDVFVEWGDVYDHDEDCDEKQFIVYIDCDSDSREMFTLTIDIFDVNDVAPVFEKDIYSTKVNEMTPVGTLVFDDFSATDDDCTKGSLLYYLDGPGSSHFNIPATSNAEIFLAEPLDYELEKYYNLTLIVYDGKDAESRLNDTAILYIQVDDADDMSPAFQDIVYTDSVYENVTGPLNVAIDAFDLDLGINESVYYSFADPDRENTTIFETEYFHIDTYTGVLTVIKELDREAMPTGTITEVFDFTVDGTTGEVTTLKAFDREEQDTYEVYILAVDHGESPRSGQTYVTVTLADINDNPPVFESDSYEAAVPEQTLDVFVITVKANDIDADENAVVSYAVVAENGTDYEYFDVDQTTGDVYITSFVTIEDVGERLTVKIEAYNEIPYASDDIVNGTTNITVTLLVYAIETDTPEKRRSEYSTVSITVLDINDNSPQFTGEPYSASVSEDITEETFLITVEAVDDDQDANNYEVEYSIWGVTDSGMDNFRIDNSTGDLYINNDNGLLDAETVDSYVVIVMATDKGDIPRSNLAEVFVDISNVNEEVPIFLNDPYNASISEGALIGASVYQATVSIKGEVSLIDLLDRENETYHNLTLCVRDENPNHNDTTFLLVTVTDVNDNDPVITANDSSVMIPEEEAGSVIITYVTATDEDDGTNAEWTYTIVDRLSNDFTVDGTTGEVTTLKAFDREEQDTYEVYILAVDHGESPRSGQTYVTVTLADINDNPPVFESDSYEAAVPEQTLDVFVITVKQYNASNDYGPEFSATSYPMNTAENDYSGADIDVTVGWVYATDFDGQVVGYDILYGNKNNQFNISMNGSITTAGEIDRETQPLHKLYVIAVDDGIPPRTGLTQVVVEVDDVNDNIPKFVQSTYNVTVREGTRGVIVNVTAVDDDIDVNGDVYYAFTSNTSSEYGIGIKDNTGEIYLDEVLYANETDTIKLEVVAYNVVPYVGYSATNDTTLVTIIVEGPCNMFDPQFDEDSWSFLVSEDDPHPNIGRFVGNVSAFDPDLLYPITIYDIIYGNEDEKFSISDDGVITTAEVLDREEKNAYTLTVSGEDEGVPSRTSVTEVVITVDDLNDNPPEFVEVEYSGTIDENSVAGELVIILPEMIVTDEDIGTNAEINLRLNGADSDLFNVTFEPDSGFARVTVSGDGDLDREDVEMYQFTVEASNAADFAVISSVPLNITLIDNNDNAPIFDETEIFEVSEVEPIGYPVGTVTAHDADATDRNNGIHYYFVDGDYGKFDIDRETAYNSGRDQNLEDYTIVTIEIGDYYNVPPYFTRPFYRGNVSEDADDGDYVMTVDAEDYNTIEDYGELTYIISPDDDVPFNINATTGDIYVDTLGAGLDREDISQYNFSVIAIDGGNLSASVPVRIDIDDVNDNNPMFYKDAYTTAVWDGSREGMIVLIVTASDDDEGINAEIRYSLSGAGSEYFKIDEVTGLIQVNQTINSDQMLADGVVDEIFVEDDENGNTTLYRMTIQAVATDLGSPPLEGTADVTIIIYDSLWASPEFNQTTYQDTVMENLPGDSYVTTVYAAMMLDDNKINVTYDMVEEHDKFQINHISGVITTKKPLDREDRDIYDITVIAIARMVPNPQTCTTVTIVIEDENDNAPHFNSSDYSFGVSEDAVFGLTIGDVVATDIDLAENANIEYSIIDGDDVNGELDRENYPEYSLTVMAQDNPLGNVRLNSTVEVHVAVLDANDNSPTFVDTPYEGTISENDPIGKSIVTVETEDPDFGMNNLTLYSITNGRQDLFRVEEYSGVVKNVIELTGHSGRTYVLNVEAYNEDDPSLSNMTSVTIVVTDPIPDEEKLLFEQDIYRETISYVHSVDDVVITVTATYGGEESEHTVYEITEQNYLKSKNDTPVVVTEDVFVINATTGDITLKDPLDESEVGQYTLSVKATDESVDDMFDTAENTSVNTSVICINATDMDEGPEGVIVRYGILAVGGYTRNGLDKFTINETSGEIFTADTFDFDEAGERYYQVLIYVVDPSYTNNPPEFTEDVYTGEVYSTDPLGTFIVQLNATDPDYPLLGYGDTTTEFYVDENIEASVYIGKVHAVDIDSGNNSQVVYQIQSGDIDKFRVDEMTGQIYGITSLDAEENTVYTLTISATNSYAVWNSDYNDEISVTITVDDINDNTPQFENLPYTESISFTSTVGTVIFTAMATDADQSELNSKVQYGLEAFNDDTEPLKYFSIDVTTGVVTLAAPLEDKDGNYLFSVVAYDEGSPREMNVTTAKVYVTDESNQPIFCDDYYRYIIFYSHHFINLILFDLIHILHLREYCIAESGFHPSYINQKLEEFRLDLQSASHYRIDIILVSPADNQNYTDVWFYALDNSDYSVVPYEDFVTNWQNLKSSSLSSRTKRTDCISDPECFEDKWKINDIVGIEEKREKQPYMLESVEIAVVVLAIIIFCGALFAILFLIVTDRRDRNKLMDQQEKWDRVIRMTSMQNPYGAL